MELLKELYEKDIGITAFSEFDGPYQLRKAARAVIFDTQGKIALLYVSKEGYHKLPGGGIEKGEDILSALQREIKEEAGCGIETGGEVGCIIEYRDEFKQLQFSYCFLGQVKGVVGETNFDKGEVAAGFERKWMTFEEAIKTLEKDNPDTYVGKFIRERDLIFLRKAKEKVGK